MAVIYFLLSLFLLYLSKGWLTIQITRLIRLFGGGRRSVIVIWSLIFLPGTIIHELSHFFFAILTGARTGKIEIFPEFLEEEWDDENKGASVALGYVQTQRLNPIQGFLVGIAPFVFGIVLLIWFSNLIRSAYIDGVAWQLILVGYLFFTNANSFFPSWSDIKQTIPLIIITSVIIGVLWFLGNKNLPNLDTSYFSILNTATVTILMSVLINLFIVATLIVITHSFGTKK